MTPRGGRPLTRRRSGAGGRRPRCRLVLTHHAPTRSDEAVLAIAERVGATAATNDDRILTFGRRPRGAADRVGGSCVRCRAPRALSQDQRRSGCQARGGGRYVLHKPSRYQQWTEARIANASQTPPVWEALSRPGNFAQSRRAAKLRDALYR
jgi:hypothetical protein